MPGHQENGRRGGTPSVAFAEAPALALELAPRPAADDGARRLEPLRDRFEAECTRAAVGGASQRRRHPAAPQHVQRHASPGSTPRRCSSRSIWRASRVSTGAACASGSLSPSPRAAGDGARPRRRGSTLRFSLGAGRHLTRQGGRRGALARHLEPACRPPSPSDERSSSRRRRRGPGPPRRSPAASRSRSSNSGCSASANSRRRPEAQRRVDVEGPRDHPLEDRRAPRAAGACTREVAEAADRLEDLGRACAPGTGRCSVSSS